MLPMSRMAETTRKMECWSSGEKSTMVIASRVALNSSLSLTLSMTCIRDRYLYFDTSSRCSSRFVSSSAPFSSW